MSLWLSILFVVVGTLLIAELVGAAVRRWRAVIVLDPQTRHQLRAWPLRIVAMFSAAAAVVLRGVYPAGRPDVMVRAITTACLLISLVLVVVSWRLARRDRL